MDLELIRALLHPTAATEEAQRLAAKQTGRATLDPDLTRSAWRAYLRQSRSQHAVKDCLPAFGPDRAGPRPCGSGIEDPDTSGSAAAVHETS